MISRVLVGLIVNAWKPRSFGHLFSMKQRSELDAYLLQQEPQLLPLPAAATTDESVLHALAIAIRTR